MANSVVSHVVMAMIMNATLTPTLLFAYTDLQEWFFNRDMCGFGNRSLPVLSLCMTLRYST